MDINLMIAYIVNITHYYSTSTPTLLAASYA
jgi:hypothetical protein